MEKISEFEKFARLQCERDYLLRQASLCYQQAEFCIENWQDHESAEINRIEATQWEQAARTYDQALEDML